MRYYLGLIFLLTQSSYASEVPHIKVLIAKNLPIVQIMGIDVERNIVPTSSLKMFNGEKTFKFNCKSEKYQAKKIPMKLASLISKTGILKSQNNRYRGRLNIQTAESSNGCDIINEISLEEYLESLLAKEMHASWPIEALKAQAVAARSYAYYKIKTKQVSKTKGFETNYDLENSEKHQVNGSFFDVTRSTSKAARQTAGELLFQPSGKITPVFFHSKCGGQTLTPGQVWSNEIKGYTSVECPYCHKHGTKNWNGNFKLSELTESLKLALFKYRGIRTQGNTLRLINDRKEDSHLKFYLGDEFHVLKKSRLRGTLGRETLPSNNFELTSNGSNNLRVSGAGLGHGVGLCQFGAKELALKGFSYKQILNHYFPNLVLKKIY